MSKTLRWTAALATLSVVFTGGFLSGYSLRYLIGGAAWFCAASEETDISASSFVRPLSKTLGGFESGYSVRRASLKWRFIGD